MNIWVRHHVERGRAQTLQSFIALLLLSEHSKKETHRKCSVAWQLRARIGPVVSLVSSNVQAAFFRPSQSAISFVSYGSQKSWFGLRSAEKKLIEWITVVNGNVQVFTSVTNVIYAA
jgi:hypothetical protein